MKYYNNKKIGITGYRGYIGSALCYKLKKFNCVVKFITSDVSNLRELKLELEKNKFDIIFHLSSVEVVNKNWDIDDIILQREVNSSSILYLYDVLKNLNTKLVFTSSTNIYGDVDVDVVDETTKDNPQSIWSIHKLLAENYISSLFKNFTVLRLPNVYGINEEMVENNLSLEVMLRPVINKVVKHGIAEKSLQLFKNKDCFRDYIYIDDVINALLLSGIYDNNKKYYVIGGGEKKTISQVWNIISEQLSNIPIDYSNQNLDSMEMRNYIGDYSRFSKFTGWSPKIDLQRGIYETIKNLKKWEND